MQRSVVGIALAMALAVGACSNGDGDDVATSPGAETTSEGVTASEPGTAAESPPEGEPESGGDLTVAVDYNWENLDPLKFNTVGANNVARAVYDTLLEFNTEGELAPGLASSWETPDGGMTWIIQLNPGVVFHDGTVMDAAAVKAHADRLSDPANACICMSNIEKLESVEATGELEVTFNLSEVQASFPALLASEFGMVVSPTAAEALGDQLGQQPVGTGPFRFARQTEGSTATFERFEDYWVKGQPYLDSITYQSIPDPDSRFAAVRSGDVDVMVQPDYSQWVQATEMEDLQVIEVGGLGSQFILLNNSRPPFDDQRARLALVHSLDLETYHEVHNEGILSPATSIFNPGTWAYPGEIESYPTYDLERARALVDELGGLSFTLIVTPGSQPEAVIFQAMAAEAGIEVVIEQLETQTALGLARDYDFEAMVLQYAGRHDPQVFAARYHSENPFNYSQLNDPEVDRLVTEADAVADIEERQAIYAELAERVAEVVPWVLLNNINKAYIARDSVHGIPPVADGFIRPATIWVES